MSDSPIHNGTDAIVEDVLRYRYIENASGVTCTRVYHGPLSTVFAKKPLVGSRMLDVPFMPFVDTSEVIQPAPGIGELTVTARYEFSGDEVAVGTSIEPPVYEMTFGMLEKPLEAAPMFNSKEQGGANMKTTVKVGATLGDTDELKWLKENFGEKGYDGTVAELIADLKQRSAKQRSIVLANIGTGDKAAQTLIRTFFEKVGRGQDTFSVPAPIARITRKTFKQPATSKIGTVAGAVEGFLTLSAKYNWFCTSDNYVQQGKGGAWQQVEEWTGADEWDADLYGPPKKSSTSSASPTTSTPIAP